MNESSPATPLASPSGTRTIRAPVWGQVRTCAGFILVEGTLHEKYSCGSSGVASRGVTSARPFPSRLRPIPAHQVRPKLMSVFQRRSLARVRRLTFLSSSSVSDSYSIAQRGNDSPALRPGFCSYARSSQPERYEPRCGFFSPKLSRSKGPEYFSRATITVTRY